MSTSHNIWIGDTNETHTTMMKTSFTFLMLTLFITPLLACRCRESATPAKALNETDNVFRGVVIRELVARNATKRSYVVRVARVFKGRDFATSDRVIVSSGRDSCGASLTVGKYYALSGSAQPLDTATNQQLGSRSNITIDVDINLCSYFAEWDNGVTGKDKKILREYVNPPVESEGLNIAILLYDGFTALDAIGPYEMLYRIPGASIHLVAKTLSPIRVDSQVLVVQPTITLDDMPSPQIIVVPGGFEGTFAAMEDTRILSWLRRAHQTSTYTTSVCTGALILGAAGLLTGKNATTHWAVADRLPQFGATYQAERFVEQDRIITAAGVSAGLDFSLHLISKVGENRALFPTLSGDDVAKAVQLITEYDPQPPFNSGSLKTASNETILLVRSVLGL